jgi:hypothetical protein
MQGQDGGGEEHHPHLHLLHHQELARWGMCQIGLGRQAVLVCCDRQSGLVWMGTCSRCMSSQQRPQFQLDPGTEATTAAHINC